MSPEDDPHNHPHTEQLPAADLTLKTHDWNAKSQKLKEPLSPKDKKVNGNGFINGENTVNKNGNDSQTWLPLLSHDSNDIDRNQMLSNNNKWPAVNAPNLSNTKYVWKELPQDDDLMSGLYKANRNGLNALNNGNGTGALHSNGNADKMEQESLTGVLRSPDLDELSNCGMGMCQPKWARMFASTHMFMVIFLLAWILQGMYYTYFVSVITTIEKLFQIKSKTTGLLMSATEIGQISTALFLTYYAGRGHRPRWIACGMVVFAIASFGCTLPHFLFGNDILHANNAFYSGGSEPTADRDSTSISVLALRNTYLNDSSSLRVDTSHNLCRTPDHSGNLTEKCEEKTLIEQAAHSQIKSIVLGIFFVCLLFVGIGQTAVSTLGIPYIDDNVASRDSPIYIAITIGVRILGPAAGFILGSFCTRLYVDLTDPGFGPSDPKWVGAWYLGLVLISSLMIVTSAAMFTFPKHLKGNRIPPPEKIREIEAQKKLEKHEEESKPQLKDFPKTIKRQLKNDILMFRTASSVLHLLPIAGLYTFLPKYLESQFRLPAHDANLISGVGGILVMGIGIVISGIVILKFSLTARSVAAWVAFTAIFYSAGMAILMFVGCSLEDFANMPDINTSLTANINQTNFGSCGTMCECDRDKFSPVCGSDGLTYFSSCHAGCRDSFNENGQTKFANCTCIPDYVGQGKVSAVSGYCDGNCQNFIIFIGLFSFFVFMHSTSEVGSMLLIMRCTDPKDKAMAMGIIQFAIGLFGNVPCPIIYGAVIDSTCLIWETICGKQGACSLYDPDAFRHFFLGTTSGIMFLAFIMDVVVWHKAHRIDIDPESNSSEADCEKPTPVPDTTV